MNLNEKISKEEIKQLYSRKIRPRIKKLENLRRETLLYVIIYVIILTLVTYKIFLYLNHDNDVGAETLKWLMAAYGTVLGLGASFISRKFVKTFKKEVIQELFKALIPGSTYMTTSFVDQKSFKDSKIFDSYNNYSGEDHVRGTIGPLQIEFSELLVKKEINSSKSKTEIIVFRGLFFAIKLHKNLRQNTLILHDRSESILGRSVGRYFQKMSARDEYRLVELESVEFEKLYAVYSNDQIKSRVLLRPAVMENLTSFKKKYKDRIDVSIRNDRLYIAVHCFKNHFEPKMFGDIISFKDIREVYDLVMLAREFEEELELEKAS